MELDITPKERRDFIGNVKTALEVIPAAQLQMLKKMIESGVELNPTNIRKSIGMSSQCLEGIFLLIGNKKIPRDVIALVLEAAIESLQMGRKASEQIDLSWTGPAQFSVEGRSNISIVDEMLQTAKDTITVVGYSLTDDARRIVHLIEEAMKNNVEVIFVIHHDEKSDNISVLKKIWKYYKRPKIYTREPESKDIYFKIHAKMVVVDSLDMLVTSANLTWHGMSNNFEMGLRVRGKTAEKGQRLITDLIESKYLKEVPW